MLSGPTFPPSLQTSPAKPFVGTRVGGGGVATSVDSARPLDDPEQNADTRRLEARQDREVQYLRNRDREVRAHERAHIAAGGRHVRGGAQFDYQRGPDGRMYAVGGEVSIDTAPVPGDPEATLQKAEIVRRAALAPAEPSSQDISVAAQARQMAAQARVEIARQRAEEAQAAVDGSSGNRGAAVPEFASRGALASRIDGMGGTERLAARPDPLLDAVV